MWGVFDPGTARNHQRLGALEGQNIEGLIVHQDAIHQGDHHQRRDIRRVFDKGFPRHARK
jgi:hypothetical protein